MVSFREIMPEKYFFRYVREGAGLTKTTDLTTGTIWKRLLFFAIPLLLSSLVQQLYNTVDLIFVGNFIDKSASAAIGSSSLLVTCLVVFFGGMSVGSGVVVSHIFGAGETEKLSKAVHNAIALSIAGSGRFKVPPVCAGRGRPCKHCNGLPFYPVF